MMTLTFYRTLIYNDMVIIFRDKSLIGMLLLSPAFVFLVRFGLPWLDGFIDLSRYHIHLLAFCTMTTVMFPAYVMSFVMLDEKDQDILTVIRVMPVGVRSFLFYRTMMVVVLSFFCAMPVLVFNPFMALPWNVVALISLITSLTAPVLLYLIIGFADNKIEGVTFLKLANLVIVIPFLFFFINKPHAWVLAIIPVFWTYLAVVEWLSTWFYVFVLVSTVAHFVVLYLLIIRVMKKL